MIIKIFCHYDLIDMDLRSLNLDYNNETLFEISITAIFFLQFGVYETKGWLYIAD